MSAVSPQEHEQQVGSVEGGEREAEEAARARARKTVAVASTKEVEKLAPALCEGKSRVAWTRAEGAEGERRADHRGGLHAHVQRAAEGGERARR